MSNTGIKLVSEWASDGFTAPSVCTTSAGVLSVQLLLFLGRLSVTFRLSVQHLLDRLLGEYYADCIYNFSWQWADCLYNLSWYCAAVGSNPADTVQTVCPFFPGSVSTVCITSPDTVLTICTISPRNVPTVCTTSPSSAPTVCTILLTVFTTTPWLVYWGCTEPTVYATLLILDRYLYNFCWNCADWV
jgi:hypothetical protein